MKAACKPTTEKSEMGNMKEKEGNSNLAIDVGKRKCRAAIKDAEGNILDEFFFGNNLDGRTRLVECAQKYAPCRAVLESTGNMWIKIHDTLEESGIKTKVANPYKTRIIAEAKGKMPHDFRVFFMGHKGSIEAKYTTNKGILPEGLLTEMRSSFKGSEEFLDLETQGIDPLLQRKEELQDIVPRATPEELGKALEMLRSLGIGKSSQDKV